MDAVSTRPRASLGTGKRNVPAVLKRAQTMHDGFVANAAKLGTPPITTAALLVLVTGLAEAQQLATGTKTRGATSARNSARDDLWTAMQTLQMFAQGLADALPAQDAVTLLEAAGLVVAGKGTHDKPVLAAALTSMPGTVRLEANRSLLVGKARAHKHAFFNWAWSSDNGKTWNGVAPTPYAHTEIPGLTLLSTYSFRVSVTVADETDAWSQAVSLLVH